MLEVLLSLTDFSAFKESMIAYLRGQAASATTEGGYKGTAHKCNTNHGKPHTHIVSHYYIYISILIATGGRCLIAGCVLFVVLCRVEAGEWGGQGGPVTPQ